MRFKRWLSGILTFGLLLGTVPNMPAEVRAEGGSAIDAEDIEGLAASYEFEDGLTNAVQEDCPAKTVKKGTTAANDPAYYTGEAVYDEAGLHGKAVKLGNYGLKLEQKNLGKDYALSVWLKPEGTFAENQVLLCLGYGTPEKWLALSGNTRGTSACKFWYNAADSAVHHVTIDTLDVRPGEWQHIVITGEEKKTSVYLNGKLAGSGEIPFDVLDGDNQDIYIAANKWDACYSGLADAVKVYNRRLSEEEVFSIYEKDLRDAGPTSVVINGESAMSEEKIQKLTYTVEPFQTTGTMSSDGWNSDNENVVKVNREGEAVAVGAGTATVSITVAGKTAKKQITVEAQELIRTLDPTKKYLAVYTTTTPYYPASVTATGKNIEQETQSVYFAVSDDGKNFQVLNHGGGVVFAKSGSFAIRDPKIFKEDGKFTIVAPDSDPAKKIHIFSSGDGVCFEEQASVGSDDRTNEPVLKKSAFPFFKDGENILDADHYIAPGNVVELTDEEYAHITAKLGTVVNNGLKDLKPLSIAASQRGQVTTGLLNTMYPTVEAVYTDGSDQRFKIDWTDALKDVNLPESGDVTLTGKVVQTKYLNNLKALNNSTLPEDDPLNVPPKGASCPDNYDPATGKVYYDSTKFIEGMADPNIFWDEKTGYYYMTASYFPENMDKIDSNDVLNQYDRVVLRKGKTLEELQSRAKQVTIWKAGNQTFDEKGMQKKGYPYIWAPEIHRVGKYWVIYFTESHDGKNAYGIYSHALILDGDKDPYQTALTSSSQVSEWKDYRMCLSDSVSNSTDPFDTIFCLDMTYFKDAENGKSYVVWAGKPDMAPGINTNSTSLYIAAVDEEKPWQITSKDGNCLSWSDYGWERISYTVNEGPTVLQKDGNIFLCYSAAGTGSEYSIGMISAKAGEDLLDRGSWKKSPYPLLTSRDVAGEEGPGHNSFTVDKDGNVIFVYHARPTSHNDKKCGTYSGNPLTDPCRHARLKRVHWSADGMPILKMTYEEELSAENETVTLTVHIGQEEAVLPPVVTAIDLGKKELTLKPNDTYRFQPVITPQTVSLGALSWESSEPGIVFAKADGTIEARALGEAVITAVAPSGVKASCTVKVTKEGEIKPPAQNPDKEKKPMQTIVKEPAKGTVLTDKKTKFSYRVTAKGKEVEFKSTASKSITKVTIPDTVKLSGITYKVTSVAANALKGRKKITSVVIGKNIKKIGSKAFNGCKKLKTITIRSKNLKTVGAASIKGIHKKATILVPKGKAKAYRKKFAARTGFKKTMKIK